MDNLELNIDFKINNPELKVASAQAKAEIQGVANTAEQAQKRVQENLNNAVNPQSKASQSGILEGLKKQLSEANAIKEKATSTTTIEIANAKIQQYEREIKRLSLIGRQGFDDLGNAIADGVEKPIGRLQKLQKLAQLYSNASASSNNPELIEKYNKKLQQTQIEIGRVQNVGKTGFDQFGNSIEKSGGALSKVWAGLSKIAYIIPGLGIAGIFNIALEGLIKLASELDLFKSKLTESDLVAKGFTDSLSGGGEYAKAVMQVAKLRVEFDLVRQKQYDGKSALDEYNKSLGLVTGTVKTLQEAEVALGKNAEAYIKMTLYKAAAQQILDESGKKAAEAAKKRAEDENESLNWMQSFSKYVNEKTNNFFNPVVKDWSPIAKKRREEAAKQIEEEAAPLEQIALNLLKKADEEAKKMGSVLGAIVEPPKKDKIDATVKAAENLQRQVFEINEEYARKSKTKDEEELQAVRDRFLKISDEVEKFNKNPKNKVKVDGTGLENTKKKAIDDLTFRQDTEKLKVSLDAQKGLWEQYENYKKEFGEERAKERFGKELDLSKSYLSIVESEYDKLSNKSAESLTGAEKERLDALKKLLDVAKLDKLKADDETFKTALEASKTYNDKLLEIEKEFEKKRNELAKNKADSPERLVELDRNRKLAIEAAKDEALQKTAIYQKLTVDIVEMTKKQVEAQLKVLKELLNNANVPDELKKSIEGDAKALEVTLKIGVEQGNLYSLKQRMIDLKQELNSTDKDGKSIISDKERKRILAALAEIQAKIKLVDKNGDGKITWSDKLLKNFEYLEGTSQEVAEGLARDMGRLGASFKEASENVGGANTEIGYLLSQLGDVVNAGAQAASAFASFASGDIIGGIASTLSLLSGLFTFINGNEQKRQEAIQNAIKGEMQYQDLLRQRALDTVKLNKTTLAGIEAEIKLRKEQQAQNASESADLLKQIQSYSLLGFKLLAGKSTADLEKLLLQGTFDNQLKIYVERLIELQKQGIETEVALRDLAKQLNEIFTGTTADTLTDSLLEMFKEGKTGVKDFADFFEQTMKDAALSIFKNKILAEAMDKFYTEFTKATEGGNLDQSKIASLKLLFDGLVSGANAQFSALQQVTGLNLVNSSTSGSASSGLTGQIQRSITEATGSELAGLFRSQYDISKKIFGVGSESLIVIRQQAVTLLAIERNTFDTVTELKGAVVELKKIRSNSDISWDRGF